MLSSSKLTLAADERKNVGLMNSFGTATKPPAAISMLSISFSRGDAMASSSALKATAIDFRSWPTFQRYRFLSFRPLYQRATVRHVVSCKSQIAQHLNG